MSDLFSAQKNNPATQWQVCLAHQLRDCQYGIDAGDTIFSGRMKRLLLRAFVLRRRWSDLAQSTRYQYRELRENLFLFLDDPTIPPTNNSSEQALRWSVIFRKVTNRPVAL